MAVLLALGVYIGSKLSSNSTGFYTNSQNSSKLKLNRLIDYLNYDYVDAVNTDSIVEGVIDNILQNLDPHSTYISKDDITSVNESMKGDFIGIGVQFYIYKDTISGQSYSLLYSRLWSARSQHMWESLCFVQNLDFFTYEFLLLMSLLFS